MDTQYQADRLRIIVIIRIRYDVRVFDVYKPCCASVASSVTLILGEKVESGGRETCAARYPHIVEESGGKRNSGGGRRASFEEKDVREDCMHA